MRKPKFFARIALDDGTITHTAQWPDRMPFRHEIERAVADILDGMDARIKHKAANEEEK